MQCNRLITYWQKYWIRRTTEHYKYANNSLSEILTSIFSAMLVHGYLPKSHMETLIVPIIQDNKDAVTSKDRY